MKYSAWSLLRGALSGQRHWPAAWRDAAPKPSYDIIIVGRRRAWARHRLLSGQESRRHPVAVLERGWIGGGNTGRNTTIVRSNYLYPESARLYDFSLQLYEGLSQALNFNIMLSQRGLVLLAHSRHDLDAMSRWANAMRMNGVAADLLTRDQVGALAPGARSVAAGAAARARRIPRSGAPERRGMTQSPGAMRGPLPRLGVDIIQNCEVSGLHQGKRPGRRREYQSRAHSRRSRRHRRGGSQLGAREAGRISFAGDELRTAGHGQRAHQARARYGDSVAGHGCLCEPVGQGRDRHGRHARFVSLLCAARQLRREAGRSSRRRWRCSRPSAA